jgi:hypothetical protein
VWTSFIMYKCLQKKNFQEVCFWVKKRLKIFSYPGNVTCARSFSSIGRFARACIHASVQGYADLGLGKSKLSRVTEHVNLLVLQVSACLGGKEHQKFWKFQELMISIMNIVPWLALLKLWMMCTLQ